VFNIDQWRAAPIFSNSVTAWFVAGGITLGALTLMLGARILVRRYAKRLVETPKTELLEIPLLVLCRTTVLFISIVALFAGAQALELGPRVQRFVISLLTISFFCSSGCGSRPPSGSGSSDGACTARRRTAR